jgi:hypothetical protein
MTDAMPCPHGCATHLAPDLPCTHCGHTLTTAELRALAHRTHIRAAIDQVKADWEQWKNDHPRGQRRTA